MIEIINTNNSEKVEQKVTLGMISYLIGKDAPVKLHEMRKDNDVILSYDLGERIPSYYKDWIVEKIEHMETGRFSMHNAPCTLLITISEPTKGG